MTLISIIVLGVTGMGYGLWGSVRLRSPHNTFAALLALVGLIAALCGTVALVVPRFFDGGLSAALEGVPAFTIWVEQKGAAFALASAVFVFGAIVGSFLNVCIVRLPKDESIVTPPSHCPACKTSIPFYDNIPLLSYINLQGRCRFCDAKMSFRYFIVELLMAALSVALLKKFGLGPAFFMSFAFVAALIIISFIDLDVRIVPDVISLPGIGLGLLIAVVHYFLLMDSSPIMPSPISSLLGIVIGGGFLLLVAWAYESLTGVEGMGGGDVKLLAMIGAFLGWPSIPVTLFLGSLAGSIVGLSFMAFKGFDRRYALPFAPFLCIGALFHIFFGEALIQFYLPPR